MRGRSSNSSGDSDDGDLAEADFASKDRSQLLVDSKVLSQIRSSSLFITNDDALPLHRDSLLLCDPEFCEHEDSQEGTKYITLVDISLL